MLDIWNRRRRAGSSPLAHVYRSAPAPALARAHAPGRYVLIVIPIWTYREGERLTCIEADLIPKRRQYCSTMSVLFTPVGSLDESWMGLLSSIFSKPLTDASGCLLVVHVSAQALPTRAAFATAQSPETLGVN